MKILYLITRGDRGGAQVALLDLISNLPAGFEAEVGCGEEGFLQDQCGKLGVPFYLLRSMVHAIRPMHDFKALLSVSALIRETKPDVVHTHTSKAGLIGRLAAWFTGTPVVFTAHTWSFDEGVPFLRRCLAIPSEKLAAAIGGKIITVSEANTRKALENQITSRKNLVCVWNGVPDSALRANPGSGDPITLITIARLVPQKDHELLLKAMAGIEGNWRLEIAGDGPLRPGLEALSHSLKLTDRVKFLGERGDIPQLLSEADVFVLASKWEGLPISILEAMRAGLPVIATDVGGVVEAVEDGVTGFTMPARDESALRCRIQELISDRGLMSRMGRLARLRFELDFRIQTTVRKNIQVYEEVLGIGTGLSELTKTEQLR